MGGDKYVAAVAGADVETHVGDQVREEWEKQFDHLADEVAPFAGAHALIQDLSRRGHPVVLASSSIRKHTEHFVDLLGVRELLDAWTTRDDVVETKPAPDVVKAALAKVAVDEAVMVGDTPWDIQAAQHAGVPTLAVLTGGAYSRDELAQAGATAVFDSVDELHRRLDETPLS
jgi:HAD superfamily hydrolase (TIGR01549 family)